MARPRAPLIDRGYLYARKRTVSMTADYLTRSENKLRAEAVRGERDKIAEAWVAGYKARQNDAREQRRRAKH